ncbi:S-adenosyl-L-methionine-dependent methyltransferase [Lasiosphaeris hirsuta]|uniref:S-adenosyl-L-methionine-dependent methyltransferase n=1 Tax=Lasiosphaeris hirsuta TaxID=260670 RepID=A0AA40DI67_9PEZI|nr:S-adenosyl-L-methionine-dependent methyltransferase [Lasiosphaeris hirsuta]
MFLLHPRDHSTLLTFTQPETSGLTSLRSSVLHWREENGRTYHALSDGKYAFPNDDRESDRLEVQHNVWVLTLRGKLALSPKDQGAKRVLDVGTGTGIWAIEYADLHPEAEVIGVDLSPIQPNLIPPNCSFEVDDIEKEWTWGTPFDFIFARVLNGSLANYQQFIKTSYENLEPGGWIEIQEACSPYRSDDGTLLEESDLGQVGVHFNNALALAGRRMVDGGELESWLKDAGFVNLTRHQFKWPVNSWPRDPHYKELGSWTFHNINTGLEGLTLALFTRILQWTQEETLLFCSRVREQLRDRRIHAYTPIEVLYAQKPGGNQPEPTHPSPALAAPSPGSTS